MSCLKKATRFIYANIPLEATAKTPALTVEQAYDIAAYMESLPRANKPGREKHFPVADFRPADCPVPEYFDGDATALEKAKYVPYHYRNAVVQPTSSMPFSASTTLRRRHSSSGSVMSPFFLIYA